MIDALNCGIVEITESVGTHMPLVKNFLSEAMSSVRNRVDHISDASLPEGYEVDSSYRSRAEHSLRESEKQFMWGKASDILTMVMSAVLMGGVTGTIVTMAATAGAVGMAGLVIVGVGLAAASLGAAYISFKSLGKNAINTVANNAELYARVNAKELAPLISRSVEQEAKTVDVEPQAQLEHSSAMLAGAAHTNAAVQAAVADMMPHDMQHPHAPIQPTVFIQTSPPKTKALPNSQLSSNMKISYDGKLAENSPLLEATTAR